MTGMEHFPYGMLMAANIPEATSIHYDRLSTTGYTV